MQSREIAERVVAAAQSAGERAIQSEALRRLPAGRQGQRSQARGLRPHLRRDPRPGAPRRDDRARDEPRRDRRGRALAGAGGRHPQRRGGRVHRLERRVAIPSHRPVEPVSREPDRAGEGRDRSQGEGALHLRPLAGHSLARPQLEDRVGQPGPRVGGRRPRRQGGSVRGAAGHPCGDARRIERRGLAADGDPAAGTRIRREIQRLQAGVAGDAAAEEADRRRAEEPRGDGERERGQGRAGRTQRIPDGAPPRGESPGDGPQRAVRGPGTGEHGRVPQHPRRDRHQARPARQPPPAAGGDGGHLTGARGAVDQRPDRRPGARAPAALRAVAQEEPAHLDVPRRRSRSGPGLLPFLPRPHAPDSGAGREVPSAPASRRDPGAGTRSGARRGPLPDLRRIGARRT